MAGKGDKPRPVNKTKYNENYDSIIWKKNKKLSKKVQKRNVLTTFVY